MKRTKILFFIFDLGGGGAEKVLVNLVKALSPQKYDITVQTLFDYGPNRADLPANVRYKTFFRCAPFHGVTRLLRLFSPQFLYKRIIKERYDIAVAYLENSTTRIIAGCPYPDTRTFAWVHSERIASATYRSPQELKRCYESFQRIAFVSEYSMQKFFENHPDVHIHGEVVRNTLTVKDILEKASEAIETLPPRSGVTLCAIGNLAPHKGFHRLVTVLGQLKAEGFDNWTLLLLGDGEDRGRIESLIKEHVLQNQVMMCGYQLNPYKYLRHADLLVSPSIYEGYSTVVSESMILGVPVLTTDTSGMREILGDEGAGLIVENTEEGLKNGLQNILKDTALLSTMKEAARNRSKILSETASTNPFERFIGE